MRIIVYPNKTSVHHYLFYYKYYYKYYSKKYYSKKYYKLNTHCVEQK